MTIKWKWVKYSEEGSIGQQDYKGYNIFFNKQQITKMERNSL